MELKTISEIKSMSAARAGAYLDALSECPHPGFDSPESLDSVAQLIIDLRLSSYVVPAPEFVLNYTISTIVECYETAAWRLLEGDAAAIFADAGMWIFVWKIENSHSHYLILTDSQRHYVENIFTSVDAGVTPESLLEISRSLLEADTESISLYAPLLTDLHLYRSSSQDNQGIIIPPLSDTLSIDESTARFSSAIWFEEIQKKTIILAGLGGIGSYVAFLLSRMHPRAIFLYDDDKVEMVNMAGQLFSLPEVGMFKVDAIAATMRDFSNCSSVCAIRERFTETTETTDIMICGFDNMAARKLFFERWLAHLERKAAEERAHCLFIDGRLAAEELQVLCIRGDDAFNIERYGKEFIFSDEEADETLCSYKQTTYMANMIGSIMVNLFTNFVANELMEGLRDLPFFTSYAADSMMFKTEQ